MPVQADDVDGRVVVGRELVLQVPDQDPGDEAHAEHDVEAVEAGHHEVEAEEDVGRGRQRLTGSVRREVRIRAEVMARQQTIVELVRVLKVLDDQEPGREEQRSDEVKRRLITLAELRRTDREGHRQARREQDDRVRAAHDAIEEVMRLDEHRGDEVLVQNERGEEPAEHEDLGDEKDPHAQLGGLELLLRRVEVVSHVRRMSVIVVSVIVVSVRRLGGGGARCHGGRFSEIKRGQAAGPLPPSSPGAGARGPGEAGGLSWS